MENKIIEAYASGKITETLTTVLSVITAISALNAFTPMENKR